MKNFAQNQTFPRYDYFLSSTKYVFPEVAKKMADELKKNLKKGNYHETDNAIAFQDALTEDLRGVSNDKHIRVMFDPKASPINNKQ